LDTIDGALVLDDNRILETGGVELDICEEDWFSKAMEMAMVVSEDEPMLTEALNSDERSEWSDAVDVELSQMEKVNAWIPIVPPPDTNVIPSHYVFCRKHDAAGNVAHYKA
jgi:hypothetical protein